MQLSPLPPMVVSPVVHENFCLKVVEVSVWLGGAETNFFIGLVGFKMRKQIVVLKVGNFLFSTKKSQVTEDEVC